ncbi:MAG: radical SAM protein [Chloroflexi bacterium]|nr:radical SAM protein [Chloroflexota bacterium]
MCFADAGNGQDMSLADVQRILDRLLETEREPEIVQISGGEPTLHGQLPDILAMVKERGIRHVTLNTNGLRLARDPEFVRQIAPYRPTIYLQFDGLKSTSYQALRGQDVAALKLQALDNSAKEGLHAILVPTLVRGVNEDEIGDIVRFGLEHPAVVGINYQPATFAGRCLDHFDPLRRITVPDVLHALETQTDGLFRVSDFLPVPCPHPTCSACTYAMIHDGQVTPIPRLVDVDSYLDYVTNRSLPDLSAELKPVLEALWSFAAVAGSEKTNAALNSVACGCGIEQASQFGLSTENFFMIQVHGFMDSHSFDLKRLTKCCVHELLPDGRAVPFCAYNLLGYRDQVRREQEVSFAGQK